MAIDEDETFRRFGYRSWDLKPTSAKLVVIACDHCKAFFERACGRSRKELTYCRHCTWLPEVMAIRGARIGATRIARSSISHTPESVAKRKRTMVERYGSTTAPATRAALDKARADYREAHGGTPMQQPEVRAKRTRNNIEKYGVDHPMKTAAIRKKVEATHRERTGYATPFDNPETQVRIKTTNQERYGVDNPFQASVVKEKIKATSLVKYGREHPAQSEAVQAKTRKTNQERYGVDYVVAAPVTREKIRQTCLKRFGVDHPWKSLEVWAGIRQTNMERYGVDIAVAAPQTREKIRQACLDHYGVANPWLSSEVQAKAIDTRRERYGNGVFPFASKAEAAVAAFIASLGQIIERQVRLPSNKVLDVLVRDAKIGVEYCGLFWHNEASPEPRGPRYHADKMKSARSAGWRLVTIFEDEWVSHRVAVEGRLRAIFNACDASVGARKCQVNEIEASEARAFLAQHHLQGASGRETLTLGLRLDDQLISVMTFGPHHRQGREVAVLSRFATIGGLRIIGGASRLLAAALPQLRAAGHRTLVSWSDNRWSEGGVYTALGFALEAELPPDYSYVDMKNPKARISKQSQQKRLTECPKDLTEKQWATQRGLARIWDCGRKRWVLAL